MDRTPLVFSLIVDVNLVIVHTNFNRIRAGIAENQIGITVSTKQVEVVILKYCKQVNFTGLLTVKVHLFEKSHPVSF